MKMQAVRDIAKRFEIKSGRRNKAELVRSIQRAEGNFPCFGTANGQCDQTDCLWRSDCLSGR